MVLTIKTGPKWLLLTVLCSGCLSCQFSHVEKGLDALKGEPIATAFRVIGYPDTKQQFGNEVVYSWRHSESGGIVVPRTSTSYVSGLESGPAWVTTTSSQYVPLNSEFTLKLATSSTSDKIQHWEYSGNTMGASQYASKLYAFYRSKLSTQAVAPQLQDVPVDRSRPRTAAEQPSSVSSAVDGAVSPDSRGL